MHPIIQIIKIVPAKSPNQTCLRWFCRGRVGIIAEARKVLQYKAFADFDAIKIAFWREFDATYFQRKQKCSDETNRQSISFILHQPRCLSNESDCCGSPNRSCKASSYSSNAHLVVTSTHNIFHLQICTSFIDLQSRYSHVSYQLDKVNYIFQNVIILFNPLYSL